MNNNKIGKFIASLRKEKGLTQQELGEKLFVTDKAVSKWERGLSLPDITLLEKLAQILEVDVSEILCGQKGKKEKINVQEEIQKAIEIIKENQAKNKEKQKNKIKKFSILAISIIIIIILFFTIRYKYYHPSIIKKGINHYEIGFIGISNLEKNGLDEFIEIMTKTKVVKKLNSNITNLNIKLNKKGNIKEVNMSINYFDSNYNYVGNGYYEYKNKALKFEYENTKDCKTVSDCETNKMLVNEYSKSLNIKYLSNQMKRIPFKKQIKLSNLKFYEVSIYPNQKFEEETSVFDMRDNKAVKELNLKDYKSGKGGFVRSGIYSIITLSNGTSTIENEIYKYVFDNIDGDTKKTDYSMETDYYINSKHELLFTRDYGATWITSDLSPQDVKNTLNFYKDLSLPNGSWFISKNELIPIAYFYGEEPKLKISTDNGTTWIEKSFDIVKKDIYKDITNRVVGFNDQNFGYVALGTDWTMGSGEFKAAYLTKNSGKSWEIMELPENGSSKTLVDFIMYDENNGIVLLNNKEEKEYPYMYTTKDRGNNWEKVEYAHKIPKDVNYITNIDKIEKKDNEYFIILSLGDNATTKIKLKSNNLINWQYVSTFTSNIHTVG